MRQNERRRAPYSKFKAYLDEQDITQEKLAELLGKNRSTVNQTLNGQGGDFTVSEMRIICTNFGISADEFFVQPGVSR